MTGLVRGWTRFMHRVHKVRRAPFEKYLKRLLRDDRVFVYWHNGSENWLVGVWARRNKEKGLWEMHCLNCDPTCCNPQLTSRDIQALKDKWFQPNDPHNTMTRVKSEEKDRQVDAWEFAEEEVRLRQFVGRNIRSNTKRENPYWMLGNKYRQRSRA